MAGATATNPFCLAGETALVTGAGSGLGQAIARSLAAAGARVVLAGRRVPLLKAAAADLGPQAAFVRCDVSRFADVPRVLARAEQPFGPITILVNNAGIHLKKPATATTEAEFLALLNTHVLGAHALTRSVLPGMLRRKHGSVVFILSIASLFGIPNVFAYSAAKSACLGMVRALATEVSPRGVRVNGIAPGWITTDMSRQALEGDPSRKRKILARTPLGRFGQPEDIGQAAVYLCSPAARFVTGAVLPVDGGASIGF